MESSREIAEACSVVQGPRYLRSRVRRRPARPVRASPLLPPPPAQGNGNVTTASAAAPQGNGSVATASAAAPQGNGNVTTASAAPAGQRLGCDRFGRCAPGQWQRDDRLGGCSAGQRLGCDGFGCCAPGQWQRDDRLGGRPAGQRLGCDRFGGCAQGNGNVTTVRRLLRRAMATLRPLGGCAAGQRQRLTTALARAPQGNGNVTTASAVARRATARLRRLRLLRPRATAT